MRTTHVKEKLARGQAVFGCAALGASYPETAHAFAAAGFDFLLIENEHWPMSLEPRHSCLGLTGRSARAPVRAARSVERVAEACAAHGIASGMFVGDVERIKTYMGLGMRLFNVGGDIGLLRQAGAELMQKLRGVADEVL